MPKQPLKAEVNAFVKGLITEASPLNFPANSTKAEQNFLLKRTGERSRRNGLDYENSYSLVETNQVSLKHFPGVHVWTSPNGDVSKSFAVIQVDTKLYIFDMHVDSLSGDGLLGIVETRSDAKSFTPVNTKFSFTTLDGCLLIAAGQESICIVYYDGSTFNVDYGRLLVRDLWGIENE